MVLVLTYLIANGITKPMKLLGQAASRISEGKRDIKIEVTSKDETGQLSASDEGYAPVY